MITFNNLAGVATTASLAGLEAESSSGSSGGVLSKTELQAKAVTRVMEMNTIEAKERKGPGLLIKKKSGLGLKKDDYQALNKVGQMTALKRSGSGDTGGIIDRMV